MELEDLLFIGACCLLVGEGGVYETEHIDKAIWDANKVWKRVVELQNNRALDDDCNA